MSRPLRADEDPCPAAADARARRSGEAVQCGQLHQEQGSACEICERLHGWSFGGHRARHHRRLSHDPSPSLPPEVASVAAVALGCSCGSCAPPPDLASGVRQKVSRGEVEKKWPCVFRRARAKELAKWSEMRAVRRLEAGERAPSVPTDCLWVDEWKLKDGAAIAKSRIVVNGSRAESVVHTFCPVPDAETVRAACVYGVSRRWRVMLADLRNAYLQSPAAVSGAYVRLPRDELPGDAPYRGGEVLEALSSLYGFDWAGKSFSDWKAARLQELGWSSVGQCLWVRREAGTVVAMLCDYVDDVQIWASDPWLEFRVLSGAMMFDEPVEVGEIPVRFLGAEMSMIDGVVHISMKRYVLGMDVPSDVPARYRPSDLRAAGMTPVESADASTHACKRDFQRLIGQLAWVARFVPEAAFMHSALGRHSSAPSPSLLRLLQESCAWLRRLPCVAAFSSVVGCPMLLVHCDASFDVRRMEGRLGWQIQILGEDAPLVGLADALRNVIAWRAGRIRRKVASTTSAEMFALLDVLKVLPRYVGLVSALWGRVAVHVCTDSAPLFAQMVSGFARSDPALQGTLEFLREALRDMRGKLHQVPTRLQRADGLTKPLPMIGGG